jgi:predicted small metal-binding protein
MRTIGCRDIEIDCPWRTAAAQDDAVLDALAQHAIEAHQTWPEDGPIQSWERVRALIRDMDAPPEEDTTSDA